jgi:phage tail sheath gpL-like
VVSQKGPISIADMLEVGRQLQHALDCAHQQSLVHRDLKPANIFLAQPRRTDVPFTVKILDFGIAKWAQDARFRAANSEVIGSPYWMAPEQLQAGAEISPATDVWALGLIAFWALTGRLYWVTGNTETATSLAAQINAYGGSLVNGIVKAKSSAAVVTLYAVTAGTAGNAISLASSDNGTLAVSGAVLANGAASANNEFDYVGTNATTADALAAAINASTTAAVKLVTAVSDGVDTVTVTAKEGGTAGNTITFTSSNGTRIDVGGAGVLENGAASAVTRWSIG